MARNRPLGLLAALLKATEAGALSGLTTFTVEEVAPKLKSFLPTEPAGRQLSQSLWYAKRKGFLATQERQGSLSVTLTYKGREHLLKLQRLGLAVPKPAEWDGKWRLVTFDIPEKRRYARDTFRLALKRMGFLKLEGSLWVYPDECRDELALVTEALLLKPHVRYFLVESFDGEEALRAHFGLSRPSTTETASAD